MAVVHPRDKYHLRSLHEQIGLFDRKLAHLLKYDTFATDKERDSAAGKLATKRETLVRAAKQLAEEGVEFKISELPPSLRPDGAVDEIANVEATPEVAAAAMGARLEQPAVPAYDGTILNFRNEIQEYMKKRRKEFVPAN